MIRSNLRISSNPGRDFLSNPQLSNPPVFPEGNAKEDGKVKNLERCFA
jgi:hypothetical protein